MLPVAIAPPRGDEPIAFLSSQRMSLGQGDSLWGRLGARVRKTGQFGQGSAGVTRPGPFTASQTKTRSAVERTMRRASGEKSSTRATTNLIAAFIMSRARAQHDQFTASGCP
jgi:hypothetical protein